MALTAGAALISDKNFHPSFFQNNNLYKYYIMVLRKEKLLYIFFSYIVLSYFKNAKRNPLSNDSFTDGVFPKPHSAYILIIQSCAAAYSACRRETNGYILS